MPGGFGFLLDLILFFFLRPQGRGSGSPQASAGDLVPSGGAAVDVVLVPDLDVLDSDPAAATNLFAWGLMRPSMT